MRMSKNLIYDVRGEILKITSLLTIKARSNGLDS